MRAECANDVVLIHTVTTNADRADELLNLKKEGLANIAAESPTNPLPRMRTRIFFARIADFLGKNSPFQSQEFA
jgi:hypothetical protein